MEGGERVVANSGRAGEVGCSADVFDSEAVEEAAVGSGLQEGRFNMVREEHEPQQIEELADTCT